MAPSPFEPADAPGDVFLWLAQAQELLAIGRAADALRYADRVVASAPEWAWAHALRGEALLHLGELGSAREASERAIRLAPEAAWGYRVRALVLLRAGSKSECLEMARSACRLQADAPESLHVLVQAELLDGRLREARSTAERLRAQAPGQAFSHEALGLVAIHERRWSDAAEHFRSALALAPELFSSLNNLALCLESCGRYEEATETLHRAARLAPADPRIRFNLRRVMSLWAAQRLRVWLLAAAAWLAYQFASKGVRGVPEAEAQLELADRVWIGTLFVLLAGVVASLVRSQRRLHPELRAFDRSEDRKAWPHLWIAAGVTLPLCAGLLLLDEWLRARSLGGLTYVACAALFFGLTWRMVSRFVASGRLGKPQLDPGAPVMALAPLLTAWHKLVGPEPRRPFGWVPLLILLVPSVGFLALGLHQKRRRTR